MDPSLTTRIRERSHFIVCELSETEQWLRSAGQVLQLVIVTAGIVWSAVGLRAKSLSWWICSNVSGLFEVENTERAIISYSGTLGEDEIA